jgi:colanic acid biosynthesis glycosyl transferase WcaI
VIRFPIRNPPMPRKSKIVVVSQHFPPDKSTTASIFFAIAERLTAIAPVLVLSGGEGSVSSIGQLRILEIPNQIRTKGALLRRAVAEGAFAIRAFLALLSRLQRDDVVLTVTAPFVLPYAVAAAARLKRARCILVLHDFYPDVLVVAGVTRPDSFVVKTLRAANRLMFRGLAAIIIIGRDTERLLAPYGENILEKVMLIPNWTTLPIRVRDVDAQNPYRRLCKASFVVGLSGNLGFTHDPLVVFEAAKLLRDNDSIHFLFSGWGVGFEKLKTAQAKAGLPNVTLVDRVEDRDLETLLSAADVWIVPYRGNAAAISVPSRFYNLLAVGRPVILVSEPDCETARIISRHELGWIVAPSRADELARSLSIASSHRDPLIAKRAVEVAKSYSQEQALQSYVALVDRWLRRKDVA